MWRWAALLPPVGVPVSLGEGGTPLTSLDAVPAPGWRVLVKDERANPTGSFKDRLASVAVSRARHVGARTVVVSSTGNAGVAVAEYARAAGLECVLLTTGQVPPDLGARLAAAGALVLIAPSFADRWRAARTGAAQLGWYPVTNDALPPVSSNPVAVHGYRTIAYEVAEQMGWQVPDWFVLPVSRGDALFGVWAGFEDLKALGWTDRVPRMLAVERHPSLSRALAAGAEQPGCVKPDAQVRTLSISDPQGTAMGLLALRGSDGAAVTVDDYQAEAAHARLTGLGMPAELSSSAALHGVAQLPHQQRAGSGTVVMLLTAAEDVIASGTTVATAMIDDPHDAEELSRLVARLARQAHGPDAREDSGTTP